MERRGWSFIAYGADNLVLCAGVTLCAWTDWKYGKVQNIWLMLLAFAGVLHRGIGFFSGATLFLVFGMALFRFRFMGAGDGKLMAVIGGYLGIKAGFYAVALGFFTGAVWSLWKMRRHGLAAERFCYLRNYVVSTWVSGEISPYDTLGQADAPHHIPFAVCLAAGVWGYEAVVYFIS